MGLVTHNKDNSYTGFLGNRMFQAASAICIAERHGMPYGFPYNDYMRSFEQFPFRTDINAFEFVDMPETGFGYEQLRLDIDRSYNILGYRQSYKYFLGYEELVRKIFTFNRTISENAFSKMDLIRNKLGDKKIVSLHLRLGDYLNIKEHHTCLMDTDYYQKAVCMFDLNEYSFLVFTNDVSTSENFIKTILKEGSYHIAEDAQPNIHMCMMTMCDAHIIANSSFSWWGAYLGKGKVFSPNKNKWFGPAYHDMHVDDIIPPSWNQISF